MKEFKGVSIPYEILTDIKLNDKEKIVYSMIMYLSKERECTITNSYISELLNISKVQSSRIIQKILNIKVIEIIVILIGVVYMQTTFKKELTLI